MNTLKISILVFILSIPISAQEGWFWQNPLPQGNNLYNIISINNNMGYACGENGTFIKITNGGLTWTVLSFPNRMTLLNLQFINETIGWVIGSQDSLVTLFETTDAGTNWIKQFEAQAEFIRFSFINNSVGWLSIDSTIYRTIDGGNTWTQLAELELISDIFFFDEFHGWALAGFNPSVGAKVYITSDAGSTWDSTELNLDVAQKMFFVNYSIGWIIGTVYGLNESFAYILKTNNGGFSWDEQLMYNGYYASFSDIDFVNENEGWAVYNFYSVLKTTNGGINWEQVSSSNNLSQITPVNESLIWSCGFYGVNYISYNGGVIWQKNYIGEFAGDTRDLFILNNNTCFAGGSEALLKTSNGGNDWGKIDLIIPGQSHPQVTAIWFKDSLIGWLGLEFGGIFKTTDGGYNWTNQINNINNEVSNIYFINNTLGWFVSGSKIFHTSDGGISWFIQVDQSYIEQIYTIQFTSLNEG